MQALDVSAAMQTLLREIPETCFLISAFYNR